MTPNDMTIFAQALARMTPRLMGSGDYTLPTKAPSLKIMYYTDSGHGWAACKIDTLRNLGIANQISTYSYMRGRTAYLEEDCDFSLLIAALQRAGKDYTIVEKHTNKRHPIRSYATYRAAA
jgi:hypothetical protein